MMNVYIVACLLLGILIGACCRRVPQVEACAGPLMTSAVFLLVFCLGAAVGANRVVLGNLGRLGGQAVLLCTGGLIGSLWLGRMLAPMLLPADDGRDQ